MSATRRYDDALADYGSALKFSPDTPYILVSRGIVLVELGRYEDALADYNRALKVGPEHPHTLAFRGSLFKQVGRFDDALIDMERARTLFAASGEMQSVDAAEKVIAAIQKERDEKLKTRK